MRRLLSSARKLNLLYALELLDEAVRSSAIAENYIGTTTEAAVTEAIARARQRRERGVKPRHDQLVLPAMAA